MFWSYYKADDIIKGFWLRRYKEKSNSEQDNTYRCFYLLKTELEENKKRKRCQELFIVWEKSFLNKKQEGTFVPFCPVWLPLQDMFRTLDWGKIKSELQFSGIFEMFPSVALQN